MIHTHLVNFIQQEQRVTNADLDHLLNQLTGHRTDIGASMSSNLSLVTHTTERHTYKFTISRLGDRLAQ